MFKTAMAFLAIGILSCVFCSNASAQWHDHGGRFHNHPQNHYHYHYPNVRNGVGYQPRVQWFFDGVQLNVGPAHVSPNRRYVRFGINAGFSTYRGYSTFNFQNGRSRYYGR